MRIFDSKKAFRILSLLKTRQDPQLEQQLWEMYYNLAYNIGENNGYYGDPNLPDYVQDALLKVVVLLKKNIYSIKKGTLYSWSYKIIRNAIIDSSRNWTRHNNRTEYMPDWTEDEGMDDSSGNRVGFVRQSFSEPVVNSQELETFVLDRCRFEKPEKTVVIWFVKLFTLPEDCSKKVVKNTALKRAKEEFADVPLSTLKFLFDYTVCLLRMRSFNDWKVNTNCRFFEGDCEL